MLASGLLQSNTLATRVEGVRSPAWNRLCLIPPLKERVVHAGPFELLRWSYPENGGCLLAQDGDVDALRESLFVCSHGIPEGQDWAVASLAGFLHLLETFRAPSTPLHYFLVRSGGGTGGEDEAERKVVERGEMRSKV